MEIVNVLALNVREPVSHPFMKKTEPVREVWPAGEPGETNEGYQPSNEPPLPSRPQAAVMGNWEFAIIWGAVQFCRSRLVAVEKYQPPWLEEEQTKVIR